MAVDLVYFAWVREAIGVDGERVEPAPGVDSISQLLDWMAGRSDGHARAFAERGRLRAAIDQTFVPLDAAIGAAREIAIFPPVTGG